LIAVPLAAARNYVRVFPNFRGSSGAVYVAISMIDVTRFLDEMETALRMGADFERCKEIMIILRRWEADEALESACRDRAKMLLDTFQSRYWP